MTAAGGDKSPRILIIRPTALGDVCRTVPALVSLRQAHPTARIDWLVHDGFADAVRHHPALDRIVPFPRRRFGNLLHSPATAMELLDWLMRLRRERYDLVFDLQGLLRSGLFTRVTGAAKRVGFSNGRELAWLGYNRRHFVDPKLHTVDRMLGLLRCEGYAINQDMRLYAGADDLRWLDELVGSDARYAVLAPTAQWKCKCWPIESFAEVGGRLLRSGRVERVAIVAAPHERESLTPLIQALNAGDAVLFPTTSVGQMMALISRAALVVCNDSAALHMAVGFDRPIVSIFGPTDPALVGPYRRPDVVVQPPNISPADMTRYRRRRDDQSLIAQVSVESVWAKVERALPPL